MSCISPIQVTIRTSKGIRHIETSCNHCLNCLVKKQSQLTFLSQKEQLTRYLKGQGASFVTLTYDDNHIPYNDNGFVTLRRSDVQKFLKRVRRYAEYHNLNHDFKVIYCGEYGDGSHSTSKTGVSTCRPHYHIAFLGLTDSEAKLFTRKVWPFGLCDVGPLSNGGIRYICKYLTKACPDKEIKELREIAEVENPFICHSIGLGKEWICNNLQKIVDNEFTFNLNGKKYLFPKHVLRFVSNHTGIDYLPYVKKFIYNDEIRYKSKIDGVIDKQYLYERDFISYKYKVAALRSQNKPVNDVTLNKAWIKPYSSHDRNVTKKLVDKIIFTPKEKTFDYVHHNKIIPRKWDGSVDWDLYLYGDRVPF